MTTKEDRIKFINDIKIKLDLHNYGFQKNEDMTFSFLERKNKPLTHPKFWTT